MHSLEQDRLSTAGRDFVKLFARHKEALQTFRQTQAAQVAALRLQQTRKWRDLCTAQTQFAAAESLAGTLYVEEEEVLTLNVGGQGSLTTAKRTLMKYPDSVWQRCSAAATPCNSPRTALIDRNYRPFARLVSFLRTGRLPRLPAAAEELELKGVTECPDYSASATTPGI